MATRETGKQRSQRIQIDYYRHRGGLFWMRRICAFAGLVAAVIYAAFVIGTADGNRHVSTGPVAIAHASFENDCRQCHQDFTPLASDAFQLDADAALQHLESACQACHRVGGHHRGVMKSDWKAVDQNCSACHQEHLGRDNNLAAVTNQQCAKCHANLQDVCSPGHAMAIESEVVAFTQESHGDFGSLAGGDSGRIKFDHKQHMLPGQVEEGQSGQFTLEMLEQSARNKYQADDQGNVVLDCSSCHQPAGNPEPNESLPTDNELGRYMSPVTFDEHCSACHSINPPGRTDDTLPLPHAAPWAEVDLLLQTKIAGLRAQGKARVPRDDSKPTPLPGVGLGTERDFVALSSAEVAKDHEVTRQQCLKCHDADSITDDAIAGSIGGISAPMIPRRWLKRGLYDHAAHRKMDCRYCHAGAFADGGSGASPAMDHESVMIGGIETCTPCHRPTTSGQLEANKHWGGQPAWATDACILCHRYHAEASE